MKYKVGEKIACFYNEVLVKGKISSVNPYGTVEVPNIRSYDIILDESEYFPKGFLLKGFPEDNICPPE